MQHITCNRHAGLVALGRICDGHKLTVFHNKVKNEW